MFFQINVTPKEKKPLRVGKEIKDEQQSPRENYELVLAPFQPQTRIKLDTIIYNTVTCSLSVRNPSNRNLNVKVTKLPPAERSVVLSTSELSIEAESSAELEISWTPQESGSWRDTLQLTDSRRIKYDAALITTAKGVQKSGKGRSRILGPANTNRNIGDRKFSPPATRGARKNIHASNLGQPNVPSKRPRLNFARNKENVSKIGWTYDSSEIQQKTTIAQTSHDFSAIMNSTKFNLTPLKGRNDVPEIRVTSENLIDFSPQKIGIISPEIASLPPLRRETFVTGTGKRTDPFKESHEFSAIMNSTNFTFTPLKTQNSDNRKLPDVDLRDETKIVFSPQELGIVSPEITGLSVLRRETYVTTKGVKSTKLVKQDEDDEEEKDNFEDSLSPVSQVDDRKPSEFSVFINDVNFMTPKGGNPSTGVNFSPHGCSTGNRTKSIGGKLSPSMSSPMNLAGNDTFDISGSKGANNSEINGTYELPTSPKGSKNSNSMKPTRLSRSFELSPSVTSELRQNSSSLFSPTPVCFGVPSSHSEYATRASRPSHAREHDGVTAKEVLEADLWVKSHNERYSSIASTSAVKIRTSSLDRISEETNPLEPLFLGTLNRTKTLPAGKNEKCTKPRRIEISPPKKHTTGIKSDSIRRVYPTKSTKICKDKNSSEPAVNFRKKVQMNCSIKRGQVSIPGVRITNLSLAGINKSNARDKSMKNEPKEVSVRLHDPNDFLMRICNPDPFGATMTRDPFLTSTLYYDEKWMYHQEMEFKKWLNALLTPPEHLSADVDTIRVDVGKVWQSCRNREDIVLAETREAVSARYHTNTRLNTLRKAACAMFRREEVTAALSKVMVCVERGTLMVRQDRDLHRDIGLQKEILELFLSYNPLWLRIGLEAVYGETIPLHSNNDLVGLTRFIITRFFSDPLTVKNHSHASISSLKLPTFDLHMNKFILKKFLLIVYFLDYAKGKKLIGHDPCLFHKRATLKESREILLTFSREVLSGVGDLTKILRTHGYVVSHKQTYLDEYDYAVNDVATDLRDGVRLCRVMELITGDRNLTCRCRVPAISRLQKVHNVDLALGALLRCGYTLTGEIDAKSVADGHREKTLSLLWQIIYKYQAPRFEKAAKSVQQWWRSILWYVRVRNFLRNRRSNAASTIQRAWRCYGARKILRKLREERARDLAEKEEAVRVIQINWLRRRKMLKDRGRFVAMRKAAVCLQRWFRRRKECAPFVGEFRAKRQATRTFQARWRARIVGRRTRENYLRLVESSRKIQTWWRARRVGKRVREEYRSIRGASLVVQSRWRAVRSMRTARESFRSKLRAVGTIQSWWRRHLALKRDRNDYLLMKNAVRTIEARWLGQKIAKIERARFGAKRNGARLIQRNWRRYLETRDSVERFKNSTRACRIIQQWWRSARIAKRYKIERKSCIVVQRWWRGVCLTKSEVASFETLRRAAIIFQKTWRMRATRRNYLRTKSAVSRIESWYGSVLVSRSIRRDFTIKRDATVKLQNWWRYLQVSRKQRSEYLEYRKMVIVVQTKWRSNILGRRTRLDYQTTRGAILKIQATWRMIRQRRIYLDYVKRRGAATILQKRWRETAAAIKVRETYVAYRSACVVIQKRYRELRAYRETRACYLRTRGAAIVLQKHWRMLRASRHYEKQRRSALVLQSRWRARERCIETRASFLALRKASIKMQLRYRSKQKGLQTRREYLKLRSAVLSVQRRWRANKLTREAKKNFLEYRRATIVLQSKWRMILARRVYREVQEAVSTLQIKWRAVKIARETRETYETLRGSVLFVQRRYRANKLCRTGREEYAKTREKIIQIQRMWRKKMEYRMCDEAAIKMQTWWKSILVMRECKKRYENEKMAAIVIQRRYRAYKIGSATRRHYLRIVGSVVAIQRAWKRLVRKRLHEEWLRDCKSAALSIERWWIVVLQKKREREAILTKLRREHEAATTIQSAWRGHVVRTNQCSMMKEVRQRFKRAVKAAVPSATVAFQLKQSMDMLLVCDTIGQLSMYLTHIDTLTRFSPLGCITFCKMNLVDKIYGTLAKSNRSIPWLDVCLPCTSILITLTTLQSTKKYVYRVEFIEVLARLMTVSIEHHINLFLHLATLLWLLAENPEYVEAINECRRSTWLLSNLHATINKKKNRLSVGNLNKSRGKEQTAQLPNSKPDWGLKNKRPRLFTTVHHAISSLIKRLKIDSAT